MVERIQGAEVVIGGDSKGAEAALAAVAAGLGKVTALAVAAATAIAGIGGLASLGILVTHSQNAVDEMSKLARQTDSSVLGVQALARAADLSGVSLETLTQAATRLNVAIGDMTIRGSGPAVDALKRLGLAAKDFEGLDVDQKFGLIADRIKALNLSASEQQSILSDLGIRHGIMQNLLEGGSEAFKNARDDVIKYGQAVSDVEAIQIEQANDAFSTFKETLVGIGNQMAIVLSPIIQGIADDFADIVKGSNDFKSSFEGLVTSVILGIGGILDGIERWKQGWADLTGMITGPFIAIGNKLTELKGKFESVFEERYGLNGFFEGQRKKAEEEAAAIGAAVDQVKKDQDEAIRASRESGMLPSEELFMWLDRVRENSRLAAEAVVEENRKKREAAQQTTLGFNAEAAKQLEAQQVAANKTLEQLRSRLLTQEQMELSSYQTRLSQLIAFREQGLINEAQYNEMVARNEEVFRERMYAAQAASFQKSQQLWTGLAGQIDGLLGNISGAIGREGKKQFAITKAIALAQAIVKGYESIVSSYAAGAKIGGPPVGAAFAAIAAAATAAQIAGLRSTNENSTGGAGSGGGSGSDAPVVDPSQTLTVQGLRANEFVSGDVVQAFAEKLLQYQADGGKVVFAQ